MKYFRSASNKEKLDEGFTLVELLVVILIVGILSAIAIPAFMNQRKEAFDASLKSDIKNMALAMETWKVKTGSNEQSMALPTGSNGWYVVARNSSDSGFVGTQTPETFPEDFVKPELSKGTGMGIFIPRQAGYCIVANNNHGNFSRSKAVTQGGFKVAMYYDSLAGGFYYPEDLPPRGACNQYYVQLQ